MTIQRLKEIQKSISPSILFLSETKNPDDFVIRKLSSLGFSNQHFVSPSDQGGGGLALFWKQGVNLDVLSSCKNFIDTKVVYEGKSFYSTFVYGDNDNVKRRSMWKELLNLNAARGGAWFLSGDFNDIIFDQEKSGGIERTEGSFVDLRSFMSEGDLYDLKQ